MATSENTDSGGMSVREAGKRGGDRVKAKYGSEFYEARLSTKKSAKKAVKK